MAGDRPDVGFAIRRLVPVALAVAAAVLVVGWLTRGSAGDRVRNVVQSLFVNPATSTRTAYVDTCDQIGADTAARIYLCDVTAKHCKRYFQFAVFRESVYGAVPVSFPTVALQHPCIPIHS